MIEKLENCGELDLIRRARERMSQIYPLTPKLWLKWINDEIRIASTNDETSAVLKLFERAVSDYVSIDLWLEYVQYSIGLMDSLGAEGVRRIFERSITYVGLNVDKGVLIWDTFREFESFILKSMTSSDQNEVNEEFKKQIERIFDLFRRQLSLPLKGMENTFKECEEWCKTIESNFSIKLDFSVIKLNYEKAFKQLEKLIPYEESILNSEAPHLEQYLRYIDFETINGSPMRVQSIYERAITDNCLVTDLWLKYTNYLDKKVVIDTILIPVYQRAVRNCTWSSLLWINYLRALERLKSSHQKIIEVFESGLQSGFQESNEYLQIWLTYLDCLRRKTNWKDDNEVKSLRTTFEKAVEHLSNIEDADPNCSVVQYWAKIEAKFCSDIERARQLWNELMTNRPDIASQAQNWIAFSQLERVFGDEKHYKKVLMRGLTTSSDWPESVGQILLEFEREEGLSIEAFDEVFEKYENVMKKVNQKRITSAEKEVEEKKRLRAQKKSDKYELKRATKRKAEQDVTQTQKQSKDGIDSDGFRVPQNSSSVSPTKKPKRDSNESNVNQTKLKEEKEAENKPKREEEPKHGITYKSDGSKDLQTVFVSNLDFKVNEEQLKEAFEKFGAIDDVRLVRKFNGLSKGYAYIEFQTIESVREALKHDRMPLEGRPVFISEMGKRSKFNFSTSVEKHKIFVKNIPLEVTNEELKQLFEKYGSVKDCRLVTYRNGHSKGCAYIEFRDEVSAQEAVKQANGMLIKDKNIMVAISNPSVKPIPREDRESIHPSNGS